MTKLEVAKLVALSYLGTPYRWGGDDPILGPDCSGFILNIFKATGEVAESYDATAHNIYQRYRHNYSVDTPCLGCLAFRANSLGVMVHVGFMLDDTYVIHASGGGSSTLTIEDAIQQNAYVKIRPVWDNAIFVNPYLD